MNLGKLFEDACSTYKDNTALVFEDSRIRYKDLNGTVSSLANRLKSLGIGKGDKVALMLPNVPEVPITYFACQKLGAVAMTVLQLLQQQVLSHPCILWKLLKMLLEVKELMQPGRANVLQECTLCLQSLPQRLLDVQLDELLELFVLKEVKSLG